MVVIPQREAASRGLGSALRFMSEARARGRAPATGDVSFGRASELRGEMSVVVDGQPNFDVTCRMTEHRDSLWGQVCTYLLLSVSAACAVVVPRVLLIGI